MSLIFTDTLQAAGGTGLYTLQALVGSTWTDIHTTSGPQTGSIEVDATLNTIAVDTTLLPVGQTFQFRWIDSVGHQSNVVSALVPFSLVQYFSVLEAISFTNDGGDAWTFTIPYTPPTAEPADTLENKIVFYNDSGQTTLIDVTGVTSDQSYSYSGHGAGAYEVSAVYSNAQGAHFILSQAFILVDDAGNVVRTAVFSGFRDVSISGMNVTATAQYTLTNATLVSADTLCLAIDSTFTYNTPLVTGTILTDQALPAYAIIVVYCHIGLLASEWPANSLDGDAVGCLMTITTDII